ncbi:MAG: DUF4345 domain-containing protein [Chitinophagaceae bacterium]
MKIKNLHLIVSILVIIPIALVYGFNPGGMLATMFYLKIDNVNLANILKAVMGLYLSVALFWLVAVFKPSLWVMATLVNILFMAGLAVGRIISLVADGIPSYPITIGLGGEIFLAAWGMINLRIYRSEPGLRD